MKLFIGTLVIVLASALTGATMHRNYMYHNHMEYGILAINLVYIFFVTYRINLAQQRASLKYGKLLKQRNFLANLSMDKASLIKNLDEELAE